MRWDKEVENKLREYPERVEALESIKERLEYLRECRYSLKPGFSDSEPVQGGGSKQEDIMLSRIMEQAELEKNLHNTLHEIRWLEKGLDGLSSEEREIISQMYFEKGKINIDRFSESLGLSTATIYRERNRIIRKLTLRLYGRIES